MKLFFDSCPSLLNESNIKIKELYYIIRRYLIYRMSHRVPSTFKLVYGHLNNIFLTGNFAWAFPIHFSNSGQKDFAKFQIFDPCTVCGKTLRDSGGGYLPAFWATLPYYLLFGPHHIITLITNQ